MPANIKTEPGSPERGLPPPAPAGGRSTRRPRDMDEDYDDDGEIEVIGGDTPQNTGGKRNKGTSSSKKKGQGSGGKKAGDKEWNYTYMPASTDQRKRNGRVEGRNLITWNRPRMAEKLLLHIMYECSRHRVEIPWDSVAHRLHPGSTGGAIVQHLNRLRANLIAEGHMVPPICQKPGSRVSVDPHIRGYIRKFPDSDDTATTRPVRFEEPIEDRRFNLPDAWDTFKGASIRYDAPSPGKSAPAAPVAAPSPPAPKSTPSKKGRGGKRTNNDRGFKREASPDPDSLDSDEEYAPAPKAARKQARRSTRASKQTYMNDDDVSEAEKEELPKKIPRKRLQKDVHEGAGASNNRVSHNGYIEIDDDNMQNYEANERRKGPIQSDFMGHSYAVRQNDATHSPHGYLNIPSNAGHGGGTFNLQDNNLATPMFDEQFATPLNHPTRPMSMPYGLHHNSHNPMLGEGSFVSDNHEMDTRSFSVQPRAINREGSRPTGPPEDAPNLLAGAGPGPNDSERADMLLSQGGF
ncbi:hypothetical protein QBC37DRAFT_373431 [Rhypophila decipiens]|uniref:Uncharacterized protein n=1 Tax=Rhypophila decipiens TaxID=261697 RepID=A0AAN7B5Z5_9PEZI|nr:hypothetical protein QBC37DRAFT_373431 [Rhypophila decipiens]